MICILTLPLEENLEPLYSYLKQQGLPLHITEAAGVQQLWVPSEDWRAPVLAACERFREDPALRRHLQYASQRSGMGDSQLRRLRLRGQISTFPAVFGLMAALLAAGLLTGFGEGSWVLYLLMLDETSLPVLTTEGPWAALQHTLHQGQAWRLVSPALLHWGILHFLFNAFALWLFGRALERVLGSWSLIAMVLVAALVSNIAQYLTSGPLFGGFSGAAYALVGGQLAGLQALRRYRRQRSDPVSGHGRDDTDSGILSRAASLWVPPALLVVALVTLAAGFTGIFELGGVHVANVAHLAGLITGYLFTLGAVALLRV